MKHYTIKPEYADSWTGFSEDERKPVSEREIAELAREWDKPLDELMAQVEPIPEPMTAYLIDVENEAAGPIEIADDLDAFYSALHCSCIDIVTRGIGGIRKHPQYEIICDDEGLLKADPKISAIDDMGRPQLVGSLLICKRSTDDPTELAGLTQKDVRYIAQYVQPMRTRRRPRPYPMLCQVWA